MLTPNEKALILEAAYWRKREDDSNPDVGIGPSNASFIHSVLQATAITATMEEKLVLAKQLGDRYVRT